MTKNKFLKNKKKAIRKAIKRAYLASVKISKSKSIPMVKLAQLTYVAASYTVAIRTIQAVMYSQDLPGKSFTIKGNTHEN